MIVWHKTETVARMCLPPAFAVAATDQPIMAWAGFCRNVPDYGPVYAGMTMAANRAVEPFNDRMLALLAPDDFDAWLKGTIEDVIRFQVRASVAPERLAIERTDDLWRSGALLSQPKLI